MDWVLWPAEGTGTAYLEGPNLRWMSEQREEVKEEEVEMEARGQPEGKSGRPWRRYSEEDKTVRYFKLNQDMQCIPLIIFLKIVPGDI